MWVMSGTQWRLELTEEENRSGEAVLISPGEARGAKAPYSPKKTRSIVHRAQERPPRVGRGFVEVVWGGDRLVPSGASFWMMSEGDPGERRLFPGGSPDAREVDRECASDAGVLS